MSTPFLTPVRQASTLPLMLGLPDDMMVQLHAINPDGTWAFRIPGSAHFLPYLQEADRARLKAVHFGPRLKSPFKCPAGGTPMVNNIADADTSQKSLRMLEKMVVDSNSPCFNHPSAVLQSTRERVAEKLGAIPGLQMPRTLRLRLQDPGELEAVIRGNGFTFPVILRVAGVHGGSTTVKIDAADGISDSLKEIPWGGRDLYLTQYVPYQDDDGLHRKMRIVVVGRDVFMRHMVVADHWHVHVDVRQASSLEEEAQALANFDTDLLPKVRDRVLAIADALELDYFGIDCNLRPEGDLLVFEANAAMAILLNSSPAPNMWEAPIDRIRNGLVPLLFDPSRWRHGGKSSGK